MVPGAHAQCALNEGSIQPAKEERLADAEIVQRPFEPALRRRRVLFVWLVRRGPQLRRLIFSGLRSVFIGAALAAFVIGGMYALCRYAYNLVAYVF
jgi:hypothetical protein